MVALNLSCPGHGDHALSCIVRTKLNDPDTDPNLSTGVRAIPLQMLMPVSWELGLPLKSNWELGFDS